MGWESSRGDQSWVPRGADAGSQLQESYFLEGAMERGLTAGVLKDHALPGARGTTGLLGHIRQHLEEGVPGLLVPELLVDLPLGVKIPMPRSSKPVFCRSTLGEKLQRPSGFYDLGDPYCRQLQTEYNSLHDPYLQEYHSRGEHWHRLRSQGLVTSDGGVVCTLKEFNDYRQYLTKLKLQAEHVFRQEQEKLQKHLAKLKDPQKPPSALYPPCLGGRLQQPRRPTSPPPPKSRSHNRGDARGWRQFQKMAKPAPHLPSCPGRQEGKERSSAFPSAGPKSFLQPVPPAGPKPPTPIGVRRRVVRLKPIEAQAVLPALDTGREYVGKLIDNVLSRWSTKEV